MKILVLLLAVGAAYADNADTVAGQAAEQLQAGNYVAACNLLRPAAPRFRTSPDLWNLLGICESELKNSAAAHTAFRTGLRYAPDAAPLHENAGLLSFREGNYRDARKELEAAVSLGSDKPGVRFSLAASEVRTGDQREGLDELLKLEIALSDQAAYWTERGWVEMVLDPRSASSSFDRALAIAPNDVRAINGAASVAERENNDEKALSLLAQARASQPDDVTSALHFASVCIRRDLVVDALAVLEHVVRTAPENNLALFLYARANIGVQQWQKSHDLFSEFDRRVPRYAPAQYVLGWLDLKLNRSAEARRHFEQSLEIDPKQIDARYELGHLDLEESHLQSARTELTRVLEQNPAHRDANIAFGDLVLKEGGDPAEAKRRYETAINTDQNFGPAHYKLSTLLMRLHDTQDADRERSLAMKLNADAVRASKTILVLAEPSGAPLTGDPGFAGGSR